MISVHHYIATAVATSPEGTVFRAKQFLGHGTRAAIDQALVRLVRTGQLLRISRGLYTAPVQGRFGARAPEAELVIDSLAQQTMETVVPSGAAAAQRLGLTTQTPIRRVYWTSGRSRQLNLARSAIELQRMPAWLRKLPDSEATEAFRALDWMGEANVASAVATLRQNLSTNTWAEIQQSAWRAPAWMHTALHG